MLTPLTSSCAMQYCAGASELLVQPATAGSELDLELLHPCSQFPDVTVLGRNDESGARLGAVSHGCQLASPLVQLLPKQIDTVTQRVLLIEVGLGHSGCGRYGVEVDPLRRISKQCSDRVVDPPSRGFGAPFRAQLRFGSLILLRARRAPRPTSLGRPIRTHVVPSVVRGPAAAQGRR